MRKCEKKEEKEERKKERDMERRRGEDRGHQDREDDEQGEGEEEEEDVENVGEDMQHGLLDDTTVVSVEHQEEIGRRAMRAIGVRVLPIFALIALSCYIDRTNLAFAASGLTADLGLSDTQYGLSASIFFVSYALFGVPMTLMARRIGIRRGLALMLFVWGAFSSSMAAVRGLGSLLVMRVLLGAAEAGTFPSMLMYLAQFYGPESFGTTYTMSVCTASALSGVFGGPLAALILRLFGGADGSGATSGIAAWRWLFLVEGMPTIVLGFVVLLVVPISPLHCGFLPRAEREWLKRRYEMLSKRKETETAEGPVSREGSRSDDRDNAQLLGMFAKSPKRKSPSIASSSAASGKTSLKALGDTRIRVLAISMALWNLGYYGVIYFMPMLLEGDGDRSMTTVALLTAIPYGIGSVVMVAWARHSDTSGERVWHTALADFFSALGLALTALVLMSQTGGSQNHNDLASVATSMALPLLTLSIAVSGLWGMYGPFFGFAGDILPSTDAAAGFSFINSSGSVGGLMVWPFCRCVHMYNRVFSCFASTHFFPP